MRKAKVAAIVCGMIASCLFGGFAVVEAATITLDDSSADLVVYVEPTTEAATAATVTSIETTTTAETRSTFVKDAVETTAANIKETKSQSTTTATTVAAKAEEEDAETNKRGTATAIAVVKMAPMKMTSEETTTTTAATTTTTTTTTTSTTTTTTTTTVATTKAAVATTTVQPTEADPTNPPMPTEGYVEVTVPETEAPTTFVEIPTELIAEENANAEVVAPDSGAVSVSDSDYILLCNAVAHEAGANNISAVEKAKVVEVIMNRVASPNYPDTVYGVLTQKYQFSGSSTYVNLGTYSHKVTDLVKEAVNMYLADPSQFSEGYLSFTGDGVRNYFR